MHTAGELPGGHSADSGAAQKKYRVLIYATVKVPIEVEATSQLEAIKLAEEAFELASKVREAVREALGDFVGGKSEGAEGDKK